MRVRRTGSSRRRGLTPRRLLGLGFELVADAEARVDEGVRRSDPVHLLAQPPDEDVHGAVAMGLAAAPDLLQKLVARDDPAAVECQRIQQLELRRGQSGVHAADICLNLSWVDL